MLPAIISAQALVNVTTAQARDWFLALKDHPERYQFATHEGFQMVQGDFGKVGARFNTREKFYFLRQEIRFELTEVGESAFRFRALGPAPWLHIWGAFVLEESTTESTLVRLDIGSTTRLGQLVLSMFPLNAAICRQIRGEVEHIKASMEGIYQNQERE